MASEDLNGLGRRARTVREWRLQGRGRCEGAARARPHGAGDDRDERICTVIFVGNVVVELLKLSAVRGRVSRV